MAGDDKKIAEQVASATRLISSVTDRAWDVIDNSPNLPTTVVAVAAGTAADSMRQLITIGDVAAHGINPFSHKGMKINFAAMDINDQIKEAREKANTAGLSQPQHVEVHPTSSSHALTNKTVTTNLPGHK